MCKCSIIESYVVPNINIILINLEILVILKTLKYYCFLLKVLLNLNN